MYKYEYIDGLFFAEDNQGICGKGTSPIQAQKECRAAETAFINCKEKSPDRQTLLNEFKTARKGMSPYSKK